MPPKSTIYWNKKLPLTDSTDTSERFRFAAVAVAVACIGQLFKDGKYTQDFSYGDILKLAPNARRKDDSGYRGEFITLVNLAQSLTIHPAQAQH